jgi:anti-sigma B factor antagonist
MPVHIRCDGNVVVLSSFGRLMNDPRHFDAARDVGALLDQGYRKFVLELRDVGELGASGLGLLTTITRLVRQYGGDAVVAHPSRGMQQVIAEMRMDDYWEVFKDVEEAKKSFDPPPS